MQFFKKSSKNKTASAAAIPAQTPRTSVDEARAANVTTGRPKIAETLYSLIAKTVAGPQDGPLHPLKRPHAALRTSFIGDSYTTVMLGDALGQSRPHRISTSDYQHFSSSSRAWAKFAGHDLVYRKSSSASKKNQTASAATTPAQTPRNSMHEGRPKMMTQDEALHMIFSKAMPNASAGPFLR
ncbi:hypothetical protein EDD11_003108 [Mortierella claussenii]|nr:hypothetical protein EDD11_003108 [Mortierella claussenii]